MIVIDASAVVEMLLDSPSGARIAQEVLDSEEDLHAPHLLDAEVTNALRKIWMRGAMTEERGRVAVNDLADLPVSRHSHLMLIERAWELRQALTVYDSLYIALAERLEVPLLTCDSRLARSGGHTVRVLLRGCGAKAAPRSVHRPEP